MANYSFPGGVTTFVPSLSLGLMVEFSTTNFAINKYIGTKKVNKTNGLYVNMKNDNQIRFVNPQEFLWSPGNKAPEVLGTGTDSFTFTPYQTNRYAYVDQLDQLGVEQGEWDLLGQSARLRTMQGMTARSKRVATVLTTAANFPTANYSTTATALAGGPWTSATSTNPYIKESILAMQKAILLQTNGVVKPEDLMLVINPTQAIQVAQSQEFIDYLKQSPISLNLWEGKSFNSRFGLPDSIYGVSLVVDTTVYNNTLPGQAPNLAYTIPDGNAIMLTKQNAITPSVSQAFSTFELLIYEDWSVYVTNDVKNRLYDVQVVENTAEQMFAAQSGYLISNVAS